MDISVKKYHRFFTYILYTLSAGGKVKSPKVRKNVDGHHKVAPLVMTNAL